MHSASTCKYFCKHIQVLSKHLQVHCIAPRSVCVDLIQDFLELVGDPPGNENSESYGLRRPGLDLAEASSIQGVFDQNWAFLTN